MRPINLGLPERPRRSRERFRLKLKETTLLAARPRVHTKILTVTSNEDFYLVGISSLDNQRVASF